MTNANVFMERQSYAEMDGQFWLADFKNSENTGLDLEFRQILCIIKHYIPYVDSNAHLTLYRSWLEKLSSSHANNKMERNKYLLELARQIKSNNLLPPFHQRPPIGPLNNFPGFENHSSATVESIRESSGKNAQTWQVSQELEEIPQPVSSETQRKYSPVDNRTSENHPHYQFEQSSSNSFPDSVDPMNDNIYYHLYHTRQNIFETSKDQTEPELDGNMHKEHVIGINHFLKNENINMSINKDTVHKPHEDSSWCDLTDASATSISVNPMGSGDAEKMLSTQEGNQNVKVDTKFDTNYRKFVPASEMSEMDNQKPSELIEVRFPLKDTNYMSADWKKTIEGLQMRLTETLSQNIELKAIIDNLNASVQYEKTHKDQIEMKLRRSSELHKKEIESLNIAHEGKIRQLDGVYESKVRETEDNYELRVEEIKAEYEMRIQELKLQEDYDKKEKDKEIHRLSEIIQQQCNQMLNEIVALRQQIEASFSNTFPEEKVFVLQKCVSKMDKLFHKSEKEYLKRIEKLKQELELRDKVTQIHLKTQRAELIARNSIEKQKQLDEVVNNLEVKYIKMLEHHERQVMENRLQDEEKFDYLRDLLQDNDIIYNPE